MDLNPFELYKLKERYYHKGSYKYIFISPENTEVKFDAYGDSYTSVKASAEDKKELLVMVKSLQEKLN